MSQLLFVMCLLQLREREIVRHSFFSLPRQAQHTSLFSSSLLLHGDFEVRNPNFSSFGSDRTEGREEDSATVVIGLSRYPCSCGYSCCLRGVLVNNTGTSIMKSALESSLEDYSFLMATNLESALHLSQLCHPLLKASGAGSIVFISSVAGLVATPISTLYGLTKGAMNQLTRNLALEWAKDNIRSNSVAPGPIITPLSKKYFEQENSATIERFGIPMGRAGRAGGGGGTSNISVHAFGLLYYRSGGCG